MKSKTPLASVLCALSLNATLGCGASSDDESQRVERVTPANAKPDAAANAGQPDAAPPLTRESSPTSTPAQGDAGTLSAQATDATSSPVTPLPDERDEAIAPEPSSTARDDDDEAEPVAPVEGDSADEAESDALVDAGADSTGNEPALELDASVPTENSDSSRLTESFTYEQSFCVGDADASQGDSGMPRDVIECDAGGCEGEHHSCEDLDLESLCDEGPGCRWELRQVLNEGTDTGKRCEGDAPACDTWPGYCPPGCDNSIGEGGKRLCTGEPTPCSAYEYSEQCTTYESCVWR
jgi:hypothetical protein